MTSDPRLSIHIQPSCSEHRYIRDKDLSTIVERPERLRALAVGIAAAIARAEVSSHSLIPSDATSTSHEDLASVMDKLSLQNNEDLPVSSPVVKIVRYPSPVDAAFLNAPAVRMIHALEEDNSTGSSEEYLSQLSRWVLESEDRIKAGESEIPRGEGLSQGDLYLCPRTLHAIAGALKTTCDAVDSVVLSPTRFAFAAIRPPGHHCGSDEPAGFCWVNNVLVGAAHAYQAHGITRVVIFDIDLHHGNGTQSIAWKLNADAHRNWLESAARHAAGITGNQEGLQIYYGSLHDILSYPCEDGDPTLTAAASISLHGNAHGQHIENVHLQEWANEKDFFDRLYGNPSDSIGHEYAPRLFGRAKDFLKGTNAVPEKTLIFVSCGFDAGEHEYESMSRHNRRVPTTFYHRFACDAREFSKLFAQGRIVGVLEGGYSDRALVSGGLAWVSGMLAEVSEASKDWWSVSNLEKIETATLKKTRKPRASAPTSAPTLEPWIARALELLPILDATFGVVRTPAPRTRRKVDPAPADRVTRSRAKPGAEPEQPKSTKPRSAPVSPRKSPLNDSTAGRPTRASTKGAQAAMSPMPMVSVMASSLASPDAEQAIPPPLVYEESLLGNAGASPPDTAAPREDAVSMSDQAKSLVIKLKRPPASTSY